MNKINKKAFKILGVWMFALLLLLVPGISYSQTFDIDPVINGVTSDPADDYIIDEDVISAKITNIAGFTAGDKFYYYYVNNAESGDNLTEDRMIIPAQNYAGSWGTERTFSGIMSVLGLYDLYVGHFSGRFDHQNPLDYSNVQTVMGGQMVSSATYSFGNIGAAGSANPGGCLTYMTVSIPSNAVIIGVDVSYSLVSTGGGWMNEARSRLRCTSPGGQMEPGYYSQGGTTGGTQAYSRAGLNIANGVMGGGNIEFAIDLYQTWQSYGGCPTTYLYLENGTWTITVNYLLDSPDFPFTFHQSGNRYLQTNITSLAGEVAGTVLLEVDFNSLPSEDYPVVVEYSTNGTTWTRLLENSGGDEDEFSSNLGMYNPVFELPVGALNSNTRFRVKQLNASGLAPLQQVWVLGGMNIVKGDPLAPVHHEIVGSFNIINDPGDPPPPVPQLDLVDIVDETDASIWGGPCIMPGDHIFLNLETQDMTQADFNFLVEYDGGLFPEDNIVAITLDQINEEIVIELEIPANWPDYYGGLMNFRVWAVDGDEIDFGVGAIVARNLLTYGDPEMQGGNDIGGTRVDFTEEGLRHFTSDVMEIVQEEGASLQFSITRLSTPIPVAGNEVVVEFTTDGIVWTQIGDVIELGGPDGVGLGGDVFVYDETDLAGIASATTQFRVRQLHENNGAGIHTWKLENFRLDVPGTANNVVDITVWGWVCIDGPDFTIALADADMAPLYPGGTFDVEITSEVGVWPDFTIFEVYYGDKLLKTLPELDDFSVTVPLDAGFKTLWLRAEAKYYVIERSVNFTIQPVGLAITDVSFDYEDSGMEYNIPGVDFDVNFDINGTIVLAGLDASVMLEVQNPDGDWEVLTIEPITAAMLTAGEGTITGQLPHYQYGPNTNIRIYIQNYPWAEGDYKDVIISRLSNPNWEFDIDELYYYEYQRFNPITYSPNSKVAFNIFIDNGFEGTIEMIYWDYDLGEYVVFGDPIVVAAGFNGYATSYSVVADFADFPEYFHNLSDWIYLGVRHDVDLPPVELTGLRVIDEDIVKTGHDGANVNMIYPTVALSTMENQYLYGEEIVLQYTTLGIPASVDAWFAITLEQNAGTPDHVYYVLNESQDLGQVDLNIEFPEAEVLTDLGFDVGDWFFVRVYTYTQDSYNELFVATTEFDFALNDDDFIAIEGHDGGSFSEVGVDRYAITRAFDLSELNEPVVLHFDYQANIFYPNPVTLPYLQVSTDDGVTYTTLEVTGSVYSDYGRLPAWGFFNLSVEIESEYLTSATHFRWIQDATSNPIEENWWWIGNFEITSGESNLVTFPIEYVPASYQIDLLEEIIPDPYAIYNNLNAYQWVLVDGTLPEDFVPVITLGEEFEYSWDVELDAFGDPVDVVWPVGTEFEFYLVVGPNNQPESYIHFATETATGLFMAEIDEDIPSGYYQVYSMAWIYEGSERVHGVPGYFDWDAEDLDWNLPAIFEDWVFVVNTVADQNARKLTLVSPEDNDEFMVSEEFDLTYSTFGDWPTDVTFAAVIKATIDGDGNEHYEVLGESDVFGVEQMIADITMPEFPWLFEDGTAINQYEVGVVAYQGDDLVMADVEIAIDNDELIVEGEEDWAPWIGFTQEGNRSAKTPVMDLTQYPTPELQFVAWSDNFMETSSTVVQVLFSVDGGNSFDLFGFLPADGFGYMFNVEIPAIAISEQTQFMWLQPANTGAGNEEWALRDVKITSGTSNVFEGFMDFAVVDLNWPAIANYNWSLVTDIYGFEPTIYNGTSFDFEWELGVDGFGDPLPEFPAGTEFTFVLWDMWNDEAVIDPATGDEVVLASIDALGEFTASVPFLIERENYGVKAFATLNDMLYDEDFVAGLTIFNEVLRTAYTEQNPVLFAGNDATFTGVLENTINSSDYSNIWFNLILDFGGEAWLLDAQQGIDDDFNVQLPPFVSGNREFVIVASQDAPVGTVGMTIDGMNSMWLDNGDFDDFGYFGNYNVANALGSMGQIYTNPLDVTAYEKLKFQVQIERDLVDLTEDQMMVFAYSVDGGLTFDEIWTYPDVRFTDPVYFENEDVNDWFNEEITLPAGAISENTIFRWRIEESEGFAMINNIEFVPFNEDYKIVPLQPISTWVNIVPQRIDVVSTNSLDYCADDVIEITYDIRGRFGADNVMTLGSNVAPLIIDGQSVTFEGITEGTGTVMLPNAMLENPLEGAGIQFRLIAEDETVEDFEYTVWGNFSELPVSIVPEIGFTEVWAQVAWNNEHISCGTEERVVVLTNVQPNFSYQLRNYVTGALIGDAVIIDLDDEDLLDQDTYPYYNAGRLEISLGTITNLTKVEVVINSHDASGALNCDMQVPNSQATFDLRPLYTLHYDMNATGAWAPVADGQEFEICEGSSDLEFAMGYWKDGNFNAIAAEWYRDNLNTLVANTWAYSNFTVDADYFAVVNDGECGEYQSVEFNVTVVPVPEQAEITVNGNALVCEGETVTLSATAGYNYYKWYNNGNPWGLAATQTITVMETGLYTVEVSDVPFAQNCASIISNPVYVEVFEFQNIITPNTITLCPTADGVAEFTINGVQEDVTYHLINDGTGVATGQTFSGNGAITFNSLPVTESTVFGIRAVSNVNPDCELLLDNQIIVMIDEEVKAIFAVENVWEAIEDGAEYITCENDITLGIAKGDNLNNHWLENGETVIWYKDGAVYRTFGAWSNAAFNPTVSGVYHAKYINNNTQEVCSYFTEEIDVQIVDKPARPVITIAGNLEFCEGEEELILTAPTGYDSYQWFRNGGLVANNTLADNQLRVVESGDYTVRVLTGTMCESDQSLAVEVTVHQKPDMPVFNAIDAVLCEAGVANVMLVGAENDVMYQLYDVLTGLASGAAKIGSPNMVLTSDEIADNTMFEIRAWRVNVDGCATVSMPFEIAVNTIEIAVSANTLITVVNNPGAILTYQWYRNGVIIVNGGNDNTLNIYDEAEYMVVVTTADGCILESIINRSLGEDEIADVITNGMEIYPNPATEFINLNYSSTLSEDVIVRVIDVKGTIIYEVNLNKVEGILEHQIVTSQWAQGTYVLQVLGQENKLDQMFIKF